MADFSDILKKTGIIDMHCSAAGLGEGGSGCYISESARSNWRYKQYVKSYEVSEIDLKLHGDDLIMDHIADEIKQSVAVDAAIVSAMDGVYDDYGELDYDKTEIYFPNAFVQKAVSKHRRLLFGASINPFRKNAVERLVWAKENNAKLVKWLPQAMRFSPDDIRIRPFYEKMVELDIPLLTHVGTDKTVAGNVSDFGDPLKLELALDIGVTVIVAHCASSGSNEGEKAFERFERLLARYDNLYADISGLTQINRRKYIKPVLENTKLKEKMIYGSDYPISNTALVSPIQFVGSVSIKDAFFMANMESSWDKDIALKLALGFPEESFYRTKELLNISDDDYYSGRHPIG